LLIDLSEALCKSRREICEINDVKKYLYYMVKERRESEKNIFVLCVQKKKEKREEKNHKKSFIMFSQLVVGLAIKTR
jgi:hypothetical protein